ncbi:hypothetical protein [Thiolapillus sp.]|uniref:hypothetical protein n=1 Tax=Thiolapillus sp. TaxID=2017437 RepID=UPI0025E7BA14|nr:hypothetical protein [Thiolapillus sp.]
MKKLSATLLATTLAVFWGSINAQVTVSSFEKTLETPQTNASTDQKLDTADLTRKLEAAGWHVLEEENGNLIVTRKAADKNDAASGACRVPCDYIPKRSYPLFRTRQILNDWLTQNLEEA